ncbi:MAG: hypothetical protein Q9208_008343, partial [Pyrenodesmia sp. 3 TL-2023]
DESGDEAANKDEDGKDKSQLPVRYNDRSFVVRGSKIGVFKHTSNNNLVFSTSISKAETPALPPPEEANNNADTSQQPRQSSTSHTDPDDQQQAIRADDKEELKKRE